MNKRKTLVIFLLLVLFGLLALYPFQVFQAHANPDALLQRLSKKSFLSMVRNDYKAPTPKPGKAFSFVSWADTKNGTAVLASLSNQAKKLNPPLTIYIGDVENYGFNLAGMSTWKNAMNGNSKNGMFDITFPVRGNHDASNVTGWQAYFNDAAVAAKVGASQYTVLDKNLTYSFVYGNAYFAGIDVPGDANLIRDRQITFLDNGLTAAEKAGLTHAFIYFHGPIYPISSHASCPTRTCPTAVYVASLIKMLNKHPIVSATFHGDDHVQGYVHMDSSRMPEITHPFEEFITGSAGAELYKCNKTFRFDYCGAYNGFARVTVSGKTFKVEIYQQGKDTPVKTLKFSK